MINHEYFGNIDCSDLTDVGVVWERSIKVHDKEVEVTLWAKEASLSLEKLDKFATHCRNLTSLDETARKQLTDYLTEYDEYMSFHLEELAEDSEIVKTLLTAPITPEVFVKAMQLHSVSLWSDGHFNFDYMIDRECSDEILCVNYDIDGVFANIAWES